MPMDPLEFLGASFTATFNAGMPPGCRCARTGRTGTMLGEARSHEARALAQRPELAEGGVAREIFHAAVRRRDQALWRDVPEPGPDPRRHLLRHLDAGIAEVDHAEDDGLAGELVEHAQV